MILKLEKVVFEHERTKILKGVSLEVQEGECISIVGSSGSGKSTLLKLCSNLIMPTEGHFYYQEKDYNAYEPTALRKEIGYCIQLPYLFGETVKENLEFPYHIRNEKPDFDHILSLMKIFGLDKSYLEKKTHHLSGGEKQRIALVRSVVYMPKVLLLDEVTASLDKENSEVVEKFVEELNRKGTTVLWITHDEEQSARLFSRRITMQEGQIIKDEAIGKRGE